MLKFKPTNGVILSSEELNTYLNKFSNIKFNGIELTNMITNTEGGISGGSSAVLQIFGSHSDDNDLLILSFLPDGSVWALDNAEHEDTYRFEEFPELLIKFSPDVIQNEIQWENYGCTENDIDCMKAFISAIRSIPEEGTESDSVNEFEDNYSQCSVVWSDSLTGFYDIPSEAEDQDYWTYAGFWVISLWEDDLLILEDNKVSFNDESLSFSDMYETLTEKLFEMAWNEEGEVSVGAGLLCKNN